MPDALAAVLADPGLPFVCLVSLIAGLVYGFAGFGSALIFMPLGDAVRLAPSAVAAFSMSALASLVTVVPGAWKVADRPTVLTMIGACVLFTPLGVLALRFAPPEVIQDRDRDADAPDPGRILAGWRVPVGAGRGARLGIGALCGGDGRVDGAERAAGDPVQPRHGGAAGGGDARQPRGVPDD
jgi:hypothetical protein